MESRLKRNIVFLKIKQHNIVRSLYVYEAIIRIGTLKHLTKALKIVKNEYIYEVAGLKSSTLLDKLELFKVFFSKDLAEVYVIAYNSLNFITHLNGYFCTFAMK